MESEQNQSESINNIENENCTKLTELTIENIKIEAKQKKKIDKLVDNLLRKCSDSGATMEEKFYLVGEKLLEEQENGKKMNSNIKELEKSVQSLTKQKDFAQSEYTKALLAKDKLENLCRELQKYNKTIKEENLMRIKDEEDKRKEITTKFQASIEEINKQVSENSDKNSSLIQENSQLAAKLKNLLEQYELREQHVEKVLKHKDLEIQLADAKFQQCELKLNEMTERSKAEKTIFETHCNELIKKCEFHQETEKQLRSQLSSYTEKYEEFQTTLKKSNQMFDSFKTEMDKMTKKIKKLEAETSQWKKKWEACDKSLQSVMAQKGELEAENKTLRNKYDSMEKISRALQAEREVFKQKLKAYEQPQPQQESSEETQTKEPQQDSLEETQTKEAEEVKSE